MSDRLSYIIVAAAVAIVIAVADANWPSHMGPQNALADALVTILP